ncbi:hypothetical protein [Hymenobacter sp. IS2118]|uniref:hypothetical protein n=1 Tax=Hymenobacter sp. IS2118 TaxID=1505605 RepID=UPI000558E710|nr:hypothetical protein [Hymenobacter sp. IS2118]
MNPEIDLYGVIGEIRDAVDALLKRGKPASVADLQALVDKVEAKSQPIYKLPAKEVAALLVPELLPLLPTSAALTQAGKDAAARMEAAIKGGTAVSVQQVVTDMKHLVDAVQEATRQTKALLTEHQAAAASYPRSVPVSFTDGWRWPVGLVGAGVVLTLLFSWAGGAFRGVEQAKYDQLLRTATAIQDERNLYRDQIKYFRQDMSKGKDARATTKLVKQYFPPLGQTP